MQVDDFRQWLVPCALSNDAPRYTVTARRDAEGRIGIWHQYTERDHRIHRVASICILALLLILGGLFAYVILPHELGAERGRRVATISICIATVTVAIVLTALWNHRPAIAKGAWLLRLDPSERVIELADRSVVRYSEIRELRSRTVKDSGADPNPTFTQHQIAALVDGQWRWYGLFCTYGRAWELCGELATLIGVRTTADWIQTVQSARSRLWCRQLQLNCDHVPYADRWIAADEF